MVTFVIFLIAFFAALFPQIQQHIGFVRSSCVVVSTMVASRYQCTVGACDACGLSNAANCTVFKTAYENQSPSKCALGTGPCAPNTTFECAAGYKCCSRVCDYGPGDCHIENGERTCNSKTACRCDTETPANACRMDCLVIYTGQVDVSVAGGGSKGVKAMVSKEFGQDQAKANAWIKTWFVNDKFECFYDGASIRLSNEYDNGLVATFTIVGAIPLWFALWLCIGVRAEIRYGRRGLDTVTAFWFGIVLPFGVLLPIYLAPSISQKHADDLFIAMWFFFCYVAVTFIGIGGCNVFADWDAQRHRPSRWEPDPDPPRAPERPRPIPPTVPTRPVPSPTAPSSGPQGVQRAEPINVLTAQEVTVEPQYKVLVVA